MKTCPCNIWNFFFSCKNLKNHNINFDIVISFAQNIDPIFTILKWDIRGIHYMDMFA